MLMFTYLLFFGGWDIGLSYVFTVSLCQYKVFLSKSISLVTRWKSPKLPKFTSKDTLDPFGSPSYLLCSLCFFKKVLKLSSNSHRMLEYHQTDISHSNKTTRVVRLWSSDPCIPEPAAPRLTPPGSSTLHWTAESKQPVAMISQPLVVMEWLG